MTATPTNENNFSIDVPTIGSIIYISRPEFLGKGDKNSTVVIKLSTDNTVVLDKEVTVNKDGHWLLKIEKDLAPGNYKIAGMQKGNTNSAPPGVAPTTFTVMTAWGKYLPGNGKRELLSLETRADNSVPADETIYRWVKTDKAFSAKDLGDIYYDQSENKFEHPAIVPERLHFISELPEPKEKEDEFVPDQVIKVKMDTRSTIRTDYSNFSFTEAIKTLGVALKDPFGDLFQQIALITDQSEEATKKMKAAGSLISQAVQMIGGKRASIMNAAGVALSQFAKILEKKPIELSDVTEFLTAMKPFTTPEGKLVENAFGESSELPTEPAQPSKQEVIPTWTNEGRFVAEPEEISGGLKWSKNDIYENSKGDTFVKVDGKYCRMNGLYPDGAPVLIDKNFKAITTEIPKIVRAVNGDYTTLRLKGGVGTTTLGAESDYKVPFDWQLHADRNWLGSGELTSSKYIDFNLVPYDRPLTFTFIEGTDSASTTAGKTLLEPGIYEFTVSNNTATPPRSVPNRQAISFTTIELASPDAPFPSSSPVKAYWVPQGKFMDIPIKPGENDPQVVFTPDFTGCHFVADKLDTKFRIYHVEGGRIEQQYENLTEHGEGQAARFTSNDYKVKIEEPGPSRNPETPQVTKYNHGAFMYMKYDRKENSWFMQMIKQTNPPKISKHINGTVLGTVHFALHKPRVLGGWINYLSK